MGEYNEAKAQLKEKLEKQIQNLVNLDPNNQDPRTLFEKEYDKVIFSDYFRKMANKTQVVPLSENDYTHSRLTHSLEVSRVGRSFGQKLQRYLDCKCEDESNCECIEKSNYLTHLPEIIATACLLHDIGNPPFGHAGEDAIKAFFKEFFVRQDCQVLGSGFVYQKGCTVHKIYLTETQYKDFTSFDGNANGFRIITKLAGQYEDGYHLSNITLATYTKYPFSAGQFPGKPNKDKFGYFEEEKAQFSKLTNLFPALNKRHLLSYLVEASDDLCYLIMDFEDAIKNGHISFNEKNFSNVWLLFTEIVVLNSDPDTVEKTTEKLNEAINILKYYNPNKPILIKELKALETLRAEAISFFVNILFKNYSKSNIQKILDGEIIDLWKDTIKFYDLNNSEKLKPILQKYEFDFGENYPKTKKHFTALEEFEKFVKENYLTRSLYCHKRKADIEIAGYKVVRYILKLLFSALSEFKQIDSFEDCTTKTKHLLRYLGIYENNYNQTKALSDYQSCLMVTDFVTRCSDKELLSHYQDWMGITI
jgi:predicted deoxyguanosinetriphosphate triphosphohydrolase